MIPYYHTCTHKSSVSNNAFRRRRLRGRMRVRSGNPNPVCVTRLIGLPRTCRNRAAVKIFSGIRVCTYRDRFTARAGGFPAPGRSRTSTGTALPQERAQGTGGLLRTAAVHPFPPPGSAFLYIIERTAPNRRNGVRRVSRVCLPWRSADAGRMWRNDMGRPLRRTPPPGRGSVLPDNGLGSSSSVRFRRAGPCCNAAARCGHRSGAVRPRQRFS